MVTWFHSSIQRSSLDGVPCGGPVPVQAKISESGPHGPTGPFDHQLSCVVSSTGMPRSAQVCSDAASGATWSSPPNTVAYSRSGLTPNPPTSNS
jgi:hypothetical protein